MTTLDWIVLGVLALSMLVGAWRGLVYEVFSLLGWIVGFMAARWGANEVAQLLPLHEWAPQARYVAGFVLVFVAALFAWGLVSWLVRQLIQAVGLRPVDRALGALFGMARAGVLLLVVTLVVQATDLREGDWWQHSVLAPWLQTAAAQVLPILPEQWEQYLPGGAVPAAADRATGT